ACTIVGTLGEVEAEYAAIRRGAGLLDCPHRGTLVVTGSDRRDFLNRMVTNELKDLEPGAAATTFLTSRQGRIQADLLIAEMGDRSEIALDLHQAVATASALSDLIFSEEVEIADETLSSHHIAVHGPMSFDVVKRAAQADAAAPEPGRALEVTIAGAPVVVIRHDETGGAGLELITPSGAARDVWTALLATDDALAGGRRRVRPIGWYAYNIARIEAGTPLLNIDFGPTNLPHETGILRERVSFTKGCYPGQEVVARLENLGRPKQQLVGLRVQGNVLPVAGGQVFARTESAEVEMSDPIGVVTASTLSPMLGAVPIACAMLRSKHAAPGTKVLVNAEGEQAEAVVQGLRSLPETGGDAP
ncbi:MAG: CAF17-like 4Fe-4S cluster assembly/insertion protein YgfZ, partial [Planctomycetota bacterium]